MKALLEGESVNVHDGWVTVQEEMMAVLRHVRPAKLRQKIATIGKENPARLLTLLVSTRTAC